MRKLSYFCGHVPQESGTRASGSLSEKLRKRPKNAYNYPSNLAGGCSIFICEIFELKNVRKRFDEGKGRSGFSVRTIFFRTSADD